MGTDTTHPGRHSIELADMEPRPAIQDSTDPATVLLSMWACVGDFRMADLEELLYEERSLDWQRRTNGVVRWANRRKMGTAA